MKQLMVIGVFFAMLLLGYGQVEDQEHIFKSSFISSEQNVVTEVFVIRADSSIHFWQETEHGVVGNNRMFSHSHSDTADNYTEFTIQYCNTGRMTLTEISYADAKLLHNMMLEEELERPFMIRMSFQ